MDPESNPFMVLDNAVFQPFFINMSFFSLRVKEKVGNITNQVLKVIKARVVYMENVLPREDTIRWSLFASMWVLGLWTIVIGMIAREARRWDWKFVSLAASVLRFKSPKANMVQDIFPMDHDDGGIYRHGVI